VLKRVHVNRKIAPCKIIAALYLRTSTANGQTTDNQRRELEAVAAQLKHEILEIYEDKGISGAKGRDKRPAFDRLHRDITTRKFDIVMAWSVDRLGRSLQDLIPFLEHLHAKQIGLYLHQQRLDTTTPSGKAMFQMLGVFAEFERAMIRERVVSGMIRAKAKGTKFGKAIGRPELPEAKREAIRLAYARKEGGYRTLAKRFGVAVMTVRKAAHGPFEQSAVDAQ
jgi:DNA invertase Pin-like site-specific DNA recombinase